MNYGSVAASVRKSKEKHPENFCEDSRCLWRVLVNDGQGGMKFKMCYKHPHLNKDKALLTKIEKRFDDLGQAVDDLLK